MTQNNTHIVVDLLRETQNELGKGDTDSARFFLDEAVRVAKDKRTTEQLDISQKQKLYHWLGSCHDALSQLEQQDEPRGIPMNLKIGWAPQQIAS